MDLNNYVLIRNENGYFVQEADKQYTVSLEQRIFKFVIKIINFLKLIQKSTINNVIINQLVKSTTSIGANLPCGIIL